MAFKSVWGFDPDEVIRAQTSRPDQRGTELVLTGRLVDDDCGFPRHWE
jgi:hypothetical protein